MKIRTTCELWSSGIQGARDVPQHRMIDKTRPVWMVRDQDTVQPNMDHFKTVMNYYRAIQRAFVTTSETRHLLIDYFLDVTSQTDSSCTKKKSQTGSSATTWEQFSDGFYVYNNFPLFMYTMTPLVIINQRVRHLVLESTNATTVKEEISLHEEI